jgi:hypothetical protein
MFTTGVFVPCTVNQALELDKINGNTLWKYAMTKEIDDQNSYNTIKDMGQVKYAD